MTNNVGCIFVKDGMMMGEITESSNHFVVTNPVLVGMNAPNQVMMIPVLALVQEKTVYIEKTSVVYNGVYTPALQLYNQYVSKFGSGITIAANQDNILHI